MNRDKHVAASIPWWDEWVERGEKPPQADVCESCGGSGDFEGYTCEECHGKGWNLPVSNQEFIAGAEAGAYD